MESVRPREQRRESVKRKTFATIDCYSGKEIEVLKVKHTIENTGKRSGDGENTLRKSQREKEERKALKDVNRLSLYTSSPIKSINRPDTPIVKPHDRFQILRTPKLKFLNPCAKYTKIPLAVSKTPPKPQKPPPPEHLYGCLTTKRRSLAASQDEAVSVYDFHGSDSDDSIEILNENKSKTPGNDSPAEEIYINYSEMPKLEIEKLDNEIVPDFSPKIRPKLENFESLKPKVRIREEKIYHEENFNVRKFLERSKNPHEYFMNSTRMCTFNLTSLEFLQNSFPGVVAKVITTDYELNNYNISTTADDLNQMRDTLKNSRELHSVEAEDLSQLQEFQFVTDLYKLPRKKN